MSAQAANSAASGSKKSKKGSAAGEAVNGGGEADVDVPKNKRHRKDKPWDTDDIDHWHIEPMLAPAPESHRAFTEESSFALLFPKYREPYLRSVWSSVTSALDSVGLACELDLVQGKMTVKTTRKTWDPYVVLKGRDVLKLLARGVGAPQAIKVLQDDVACDIIKIGGLVRNKERFVKRRQRIVGPNGSTLKAIELLTDCYVLVQGNTVSAMGSYKGLKEVRRIIIDCMNNVHPIYRIKELMIRRELAKDPKLVNENWDRFLPKFQKRHLKTSEKTARKNAALERHAEASASASGQASAMDDPLAAFARIDTTGSTSMPSDPTSSSFAASASASASAPNGKQPAKKKKVYTPFPPPMPPSKLDLQLASGEYFLKPQEKEAIEKKKVEDRQAARAAEKRATREEAFVAPVEERVEGVKERRKRKRDREA